MEIHTSNSYFQKLHEGTEALLNKISDDFLSPAKLMRDSDEGLKNVLISAMMSFDREKKDLITRLNNPQK